MPERLGPRIVGIQSSAVGSDPKNPRIVDGKSVDELGIERVVDALDAAEMEVVARRPVDAVHAPVLKPDIQNAAVGAFGDGPDITRSQAPGIAAPVLVQGEAGIFRGQLVDAAAAGSHPKDAGPVLE